MFKEMPTIRKDSLPDKNNEIREDDDSLESFTSSSDEAMQRKDNGEKKKSNQTDQTYNRNTFLRNSGKNILKIIKNMIEKDPNIIEPIFILVNYLFTERNPKMVKNTSEVESQSQNRDYSLSSNSVLSQLRLFGKNDLKIYLDLLHHIPSMIHNLDIPRILKLTSPLFNRYTQDFHEIGLIGLGGFGAVFRARHNLDDQEYAIKKINLNSSDFPLCKNDIITLEEVKLLSQINHPNVAKYYNSWIQFDLRQFTKGSTEGYYPVSALSSRIEESFNNSSSIIFSNSGSENNMISESKTYTSTVDTSSPNSSCIIFSSNSVDVASQNSFISESQRYRVDTTSSPIPLEETRESLNSNRDPEQNTHSQSSKRETSESRKKCDKLALVSHRSRKIISPLPYKSLLLFIQMELGKETLRDWIKERNEKINNKSYEINRKEIIKHVRIFKEIMLAVEHIHSKCIIHRDIKPENILMTSDERILLADFGLAKRHENGRPKIGSDVGTPPYDAPEIAKRKPYNNKVDIFSLGIILLELIHSFSTEAERAIVVTALKKRQQIDKYLTKCTFMNPLLLQMTEKDPELRPSASEILSELQEIGNRLNTPAFSRSISDGPVLPTNNSKDNEISHAKKTLRPCRHPKKKRGKLLGKNYNNKENLIKLIKKQRNELEEKNLEIEQMRSKINELELNVKKLEKKPLQNSNPQK